MKRFKGYSLSWWIIEIVGLVLFIFLVSFMIVDAIPVFKISVLSASQKITYAFGTFFVCYGLGYFVDDIVKFMRKFIRRCDKNKSGYSQEKIDRIKDQMKHSTDHLK